MPIFPVYSPIICSMPKNQHTVLSIPNILSCHLQYTQHTVSPTWHFRSLAFQSLTLTPLFSRGLTDRPSSLPSHSTQHILAKRTLPGKLLPLWKFIRKSFKVSNTCQWVTWADPLVQCACDMTQYLAQKSHNSVTPYKSWLKTPKSFGEVGISFSLIELYQASFDQREAAAVVATPRRSKTPQTTQTELPSHSQMGFFSRGILMNLGNEKTTRIAISLANGVGHGLSFFFFTPNIFIRIRKCKEYSLPSAAKVSVAR